MGEIIIRKKTPEELEEKIFELVAEIALLKHNWKELKEWLEDGFYWSYYEEDLSSGRVVEIIKDKMQELEKESDVK